MQRSQLLDLIQAVLGTDQVAFDEDGLCTAEAEDGVALAFVDVPPRLKVYCVPLSRAEYEATADRLELLEGFLSLNLSGEEVEGVPALRTGFLKEAGVPIVAGGLPVEGLAADRLEALCTNLHAIAVAVRRAMLGLPAEAPFKPAADAAADAAADTGPAPVDQVMQFMHLRP